MAYQQTSYRLSSFITNLCVGKFEIDLKSTTKFHVFMLHTWMDMIVSCARMIIKEILAGHCKQDNWVGLRWQSNPNIDFMQQQDEDTIQLKIKD